MRGQLLIEMVRMLLVQVDEFRGAFLHAVHGIRLQHMIVHGRPVRRSRRHAVAMLMVMLSCHVVVVAHRLVEHRALAHVIRLLQGVAGHLRRMMVHDRWRWLNDILLILIAEWRLLLLNGWLIDWRVFPLLLVLERKKRREFCYRARTKSLTLA